MGLALVRLLALSLLMCAVVLAQPQPQGGQLDGSETLFTVLAAINAAGYDANVDSNANSPVRKQVRDAIAQKHLGSVEALKKFFADHRQEDPEAELNQYISFALSLQGPPDFQFWMPTQEVPPDVRKLDGLNELIADFYKEAGYRRSLETVATGLASRDRRSIMAASCRRCWRPMLTCATPPAAHVEAGFQIYVDLLGAPNQIQTRSYKSNYYVVVTPSPEPQVDQVRHAYLHFLLDPLSLRYFEQWGRDKSSGRFCAIRAGVGRRLQERLHAAGHRVRDQIGGKPAGARRRRNKS